MPSRITNDVAVLACVFVLFICRAVVASAIVSPWQGPDEPGHFIPVRLLAGQADSITLEGDVLQSMAKHRWWEPYGGRSPEVPPKLFSQAAERLAVATTAQPMYYSLGALVLRVPPAPGLEDAYWRLRFFSIVMAMASLALAWAGTRALFDGTVATGATAIAALHPQFLLTAISVNPDALAILMGALIWWLVACVTTGRRVEMSLASIVVAAVTAVMTKRNIAPFAAFAVLLALALLVRTVMPRITRRMLVWIGALAIVAVIVLAAVVAAFDIVAEQLLFYWQGAFFGARRPERLAQAVEYAGEALDYVWLIAGWLRFSAPEPWLWVVRVLTIAGFAGAAALTTRSRALRPSLLIAWLFVMVQTTVVIGWGFWTLSSPQGRYLYPVVAPATALLWLGLTHLPPARFRVYAAPLLIATLAVLDVTAFASVLIPAYLPWG